MQDSKYCYLTGVISIHALLWSATYWDKSWIDFNRFLSTHSCGVRLEQFWEIYPTKRFLSTHSCGVRPLLTAAQKQLPQISIHALLWSATALARQLKSWETISIHALLWSATIGFSIHDSDTEISIHALLWSATR